MNNDSRAAILSAIRAALAGSSATTRQSASTATIANPLVAAQPSIADPIATFTTAATAVGTEVIITTATDLEPTLAHTLTAATKNLAELSAHNRPLRIERFPGGSEADPFDIDIAVVPASLGIANFGAVLLESPKGPRLAPMTAEITIAILDARTLVGTLHEALAIHRPGPTRLLVTGPSKTADIEGVLVTGVHGPRRFLVVLTTT